MELKIYKTFKFLLISLIILMTSCIDDFLDREPRSALSPEGFFNTESDLAFYANRYYQDLLPSHSGGLGDGQNPEAWQYGTYGIDRGTDNLANWNSPNKRFIPGEVRVGESGGEWDFGMAYNLNYFLDNVLPKYEAGTITGDVNNIKHYIGEIYFLRAFWYFNKLKNVGDFPIITNVLSDQNEVLVEASKRAPRNEVARFIISDLNKAIDLLMPIGPDNKKQRITRDVAYLLKSRVGLFEGTWLKYFKNTPFVPNGEGWPGKTKEYNANYQFPSGSIENEINYFLEQSMEAAALVADNVPLVTNTGLLQQSYDEPANPYVDMFGDVDMSKYSEVLLWREYSIGQDIVHATTIMAQNGNAGHGMTRGLVQSFIMNNGLPIYAPGSGYAGDDFLEDVRRNRDGRLQLFLKLPGEINVFNTHPNFTHGTVIEQRPRITSGEFASAYNTGYACRKGNNPDAIHGGNGRSGTGSIAFRSVEANLNYIEACYERYGRLDAKADLYWKGIRERANTDIDYMKTIAATNMTIEGETDWGAYSNGTLIDPFLFNIRRERRMELMGDGLRYMDLRRWKAMDQMITTPYHIEGFKLWGPMESWYTELEYGLENTAANVSPPPSAGGSVYLRPYQKTSRSLAKEGYKWNMAHYLSPIANRHFILTSTDGDLSTSPIYQNPGWSIEANSIPVDMQ